MSNRTKCEWCANMQQGTCTRYWVSMSDHWDRTQFNDENNDGSDNIVYETFEALWKHMREFIRC